MTKFELRHQLPNHVRGAYVAFSPDGKVLASSSKEGLRFWDVTTGKQLASLNGKIDDPVRLCYSPDGKTLALGTMTKKVILWDIEGEKVQATLNRNPDWVTALLKNGDSFWISIFSQELRRNSERQRGRELFRKRLPTPLFPNCLNRKPGLRKSATA